MKVLYTENDNSLEQERIQTADIWPDEQVEKLGEDENSRPRYLYQLIAWVHE